MQLQLNSKLKNLDGLSSLEYIRWELEVNTNHNLEDVSALEGIAGPERFFTIAGNGKLDNCLAHALYASLGNPNLPQRIHGNLANAECPDTLVLAGGDQGLELAR